MHAKVNGRGTTCSMIALLLGASSTCTVSVVGGIRAVLVQTTHPEVVAGVEQHSRYRSDPLGRLSRTSAYVTETTYGAHPEVDAAVAAVWCAHRPVHGRSDRGASYSAGQPELAAWVHNVLTESFLSTFQAYRPRRLTDEECDRFVSEQTRVGTLLGTSPLPTSAEELNRWVGQHPALQRSADQGTAVGFLRSPPLPVLVRPGYRLLYEAAVATLPPAVAEIVGACPLPAGRAIRRASVGSLRWMLGSSPLWHLALQRCGALVPPGLFRQLLTVIPDSVLPV
jgi:uncharacterized protein (DUF2236 family)